MTSIHNPRYTREPCTRFVVGAWHDLISELHRVERQFREHGYTKEAEALRAHGGVFAHHCVMHCERLLGPDPIAVDEFFGATDSQPVADSHRQPDEKQQAPLHETGASTDGGHANVTGEGVAAAPASDVVSIPLDVVIQRRIDELTARAKEEQRYEVAIKYLYRARAMLDAGCDDKGRLLTSERRTDRAWQLIRAAANVLEPMEASNG